MSSDEYRKALGDLGLSQTDIAVMLRKGEKQPQRWANGQTPVPEEVAIILRAMLQGECGREVIRKAVDAGAHSQRQQGAANALIK